LQFIQTDVEKQIYEADYSFKTFWNFSEIVIYLGYALFFIVACPIAPLLLLLNNVLEIWVDQHNLLVNRRPVPESSRGIGKVWNRLLFFIGFLAVMTNAWLMSFHTDEVLTYSKQNPSDSNTDVSKVWFFTVGVSLVFLIFVVTWTCSSDSSKEIRRAVKRQKEVEKWLVTRRVTIWEAAEEKKGLDLSTSASHSEDYFSKQIQTMRSTELISGSYREKSRYNRAAPYRSWKRFVRRK
jgi:hypothetical protein